MSDYLSELRKDPVSGDWVVIAPGRARRPQKLISKIKTKRAAAPKSACPFENPQKSGNREPLLVYPAGKGNKNKNDWTLQVIENKFPVFSALGRRPRIVKNGLYQTMEGTGRHELVITRDHHKDFCDLGAKANLVLSAFQERFREFRKDSDLVYALAFHNFGPKSGASVYHPHYQIIGLPIIPPAVGRSLAGSRGYFKKHKKCVHCEMIAWEKKKKNRIIFENSGAIVFAPFISREPFEMRVFPKKHISHFEKTSPRDLALVSEALSKAIARMKKKLGDPDYNFFIHAAPINGKEKFDFYHWHIEILPKISISAGFELGTGIEATVVDPDAAAKILK